MESLSDRIADVRRKAVEFADAEDNTHLSNREWYERKAAYTAAASPDLIIQMADRIEELEKALKELLGDPNWGCDRPTYLRARAALKEKL